MPELRRIVAVLPVLLILVVAVGCQAGRFSTPASAYTFREVPAPSGQQFPVTYNYGCRSYKMLTLTSADETALAAFFAPAPVSAADERVRVSRAVAWCETTMGARAGTDGDIAGTVTGTFMKNQQDCVDESMNTTTYMLLMERLGHLTHHTVKGPSQRANFAIIKFPHWTAVLTETQTGIDWSVDSWFYDNGIEPEVQPLSRWRSFKRPPAHPLPAIE